MGPTTAVAAIRAAVREHLQDRVADGGLRTDDLILVACSGGPDSVALASQAAFVAPRLGLRAGAIVVDHALQPDSSEHAAQAARTCVALGLDPVLVRTAAPATGAGPETRARAVRYAQLRAAVQASGAVGILLGHTLDDQAETVLLALARGSGIRAMAGMAPSRDEFWRPLLAVRRASTHQACADLGLATITDPTNATDGPWRRADAGPLPRAAIRDDVLPVLARALGVDPAPALARTARLARADVDLLDALASDAWEQCRGPGGDLDVVVLAAQPKALRSRVLRLAALDAGVRAGDLRESHLSSVEDLITDWHGQGEIALPGGVVVRRDCGRLVLAGRR